MLDFRLSEEQSQIVSAVARTLETEPVNSGDRGQVTRLGELGWVGLALPEACGGAGGTVVDGALVAFEFGRALASPDLLATQAAAMVAFSAGDLDLARAFAAGQRSAGFCLTPAGTEKEGGKSVVYLLRAHAAAGYVRFRGDACEIVQEPRGRRRACVCIDPDMILESAETSSFDVLIHKTDMDLKVVQCSLIFLSAMLAGIAESSRDLAVAYTKTRRQFGRFIGEFQAIKHHCANMHLRARAAFAQTMHAAMLTAAALPGGRLQAMAALEVSAAAAIDNGEMGVHIQGGMGFSEECSAHRYLKRAQLLRIISADAATGLGTPFERLAGSIAAPSES